jgi:hypothetical protein
MASHNLSTLFVMAHPAIRSFITERLQQVGGKSTGLHRKNRRNQKERRPG